MKLAVGWWKPHPTEPEWDICTVCGIGTHRRQITMDFVEEENYQYCPHCGARLYEQKHTIDAQSGTVSLKNGENQF